MRWMVVAALLALAGCAGPTGPMGAQGAKGDPGPAATDGSKIIASIHCGGALAGTQISFSYDVAQFQNGNVFCGGDIDDPAASAFDSQIYAPSQNGYTSAPVLVTLDEYGTANGGFWIISLNRQTLTTTVNYIDPDVPAATQSTWTIPASSCVANAY